MSAEALSLSKSSNATLPRQERLPGLVWLRAIGALLVVILHAGMPYLSPHFPGLIWSVDSEVKSRTITMIVWSIDGFIMPLFFLMSGYLAAQLFSQKGPDSFLRHRWSRLGYPFLFAMIILMPIDLNIWIIGWISEEWVHWRKLYSLKFDPPYSDAIWGVGHLWYLQYLIAYCTGAWLIDRVAGQSAKTDVPAIRSHFWQRLPAASGPLSLAAGILCAATVLWWQPRIVIGFRHSWWPLWENLAYYSVPFTLGWCWQRQQLHPGKSGLSVTILFLGSISCGIALIPLLKIHLAQESIPCANPLLTLLWASFGLLLSAAIFKYCLSWKAGRVPAAIIYLSNASFWIYLAHHPIAGLINIPFDQINWPPVLEFAITIILAVVLSLMTYEVGIRRTWAGTLFSGEKRSRKPVLTGSTLSGELPDTDAKQDPGRHADAVRQSRGASQIDFSPLAAVRSPAQ